MPPEYVSIRACKILNCKAWELAERPDGAYWQDWALICEKADNIVEKAMMDKAKKGKK